AHACRFEDLPMGLLRGSTILCCVDSRAARQAVNRSARALDLAWIDAALSREGHVRGRVYLPGPASDCLECSWGTTDYELLEQRLPCQSPAGEPASTDAPIELGAIAAAIQVALLRRLGSGPEAVDVIAGQQWFYDLPSGRGWTGRYSANPACRLDHAPWDISVLEPGSARTSLADALALAGPPSADNTLAVPGRVFVRRMRCPACGSAWRIQCRLSGRVATTVCPGCRVPLLASALDADELLQAGRVSAAVLREPLTRRGLVAGDVIEVGAGRATRHFQLA
ncbi:MAG: ThiF family adenylyltransferase, partial [Rhizobacter sp.]|nr:ThiF family adenylyltransferase [Rhizobacter sp.]